MTRKEKLIAMVWVLVVVSIAGFALAWFADRDEKLMVWAEAYEKCVADEYGMTPIAWHAEHGEYPPCDTNK